MDKLEVIGISGRAGSGKDYIATQFLAPMGYLRFSLAWHFKVWVVGKGEASHEEVFHTKPPHVRKLLQEEGTERGRNVYGSHIWTNTTEEWMRVLAENNGLTKFVIPDIRFPDEVEFVKRLGGQVFRVVAPKRAAASNLSSLARLHISETALDDYDKFDGFIYNDPQHAETVKRQVCYLLDSNDQLEDTEEHAIWNKFDKVFDKMDDLFDKFGF